MLNGVYKSCSKFGPQTFPVERNVVIRDNLVQLLNDDATDGGPFVFGYDNFFHVNNLGERVGDVPVNFEFGTAYVADEMV